MKEDFHGLLSIDPGNRITGWAYFDCTQLVHAEAIQGPVAVKQVGWMKSRPFAVSYTVIEAPRWYPREHKIDVNDLLDLAILVGELKNEWGSSVEIVYPRTWKGTVPKKIHNQRVLAVLDPEELAVLPKRPRAKDFDNNMVDAIGIGLWKLGRM